MRLIYFLILAAIGCSFGATSASNVFSQSPVTNWREQRMAVEREFGEELQAIAQWCRENGIPQQVEPTLQLYLERDLGRQYIFVPSELSMPTIPEGILGQWQSKINDANVAHAARIFELAKKASDQDAGATAYQLLHEVINYDLDHAAVRQILGHQKSNHGWNVAPVRIQVNRDTRAHDVISWPAKSYLRVLTPHFEIESNAGEDRTRHLAKQLERAHLVWRQVFFEYWSSSSALKRWIKGSGSPRISNKRFRVVFFPDKNSYIRTLGPSVRGIEDSTGYYDNDQQISFFYDGDEVVETNWRHELTHQLFRESGRVNRNAFENHFIWLDEGIATYLESMSDFESYVTLGGFDTRRIQFARVRLLFENPFLPLEQLAAIGRTNLQRRPDMARIYSQSAGLVDLLMNGENGRLQQPLIQFLKLIYRGRVKPGAFEKIIGNSFDELDEKFVTHLSVSSDVVEKHLIRPRSRTELSLPAAKLSPAAFDAIGQCVNLEWLDISKNEIRSADLARLKSCNQINQLFLNGCRFEENTLRELLLFGKLDELDLSGSSVRDSQLATFKNLRNLKSLSLSATGVTDKALIHLADVKSLRTLDVTQTEVTNQGIENLKASNPNLQVTK